MPDDADARLRHLGAFEKSLTALPWFAAAGQPLDPAERDDAAAYLQGLGLDGASIETVADWTGAEITVQRTDFSAQWWDREEALGRELTRTAADALGQATVDTRLSQIGRTASDHLQGAASVALSRFGVVDPGLGKSAAGAATMAVYHAALALAAGCGGDHPFAAKFRLFQAGHWPLGVYGGVFFVL